jgi:hypothetical protein
VGGPIRVAVLTTASGQGSTHVAAALAWEGAAGMTTVAVDADPNVGTFAEIFALEPEVRLSSVWGPSGVSAAALSSAMTRVRDRQRLQVVAGFDRPVAEWPAVLEALAAALPQLACDLVVVDLGAPFGPLRGAPPLGVALGTVFDAVVLVLGSEPDLLWRSIRLLDASPLPRTRVVLMRPRGERGGQVEALVRRELPWLPPFVEWTRDQREMLSAQAEHRPVLRRGGLLAELGLSGQARVSRPRGRGFAWWRRPAVNGAEGDA